MCDEIDPAFSLRMSNFTVFRGMLHHYTLHVHVHAHVHAQHVHAHAHAHAHVWRLALRIVYRLIIICRTR